MVKDAAIALAATLNKTLGTKEVAEVDKAAFGLEDGSCLVIEVQPEGWGSLLTDKPDTAFDSIKDATLLEKWNLAVAAVEETG